MSHRYERRNPRVSVPQATPATDGTAALASRYLLDDYSPEDVAALLGVSVAWSRSVQRRLRRSAGDAA
jgi:transposase